MMFTIGEKASITRKITDEDVVKFAELTGDKNPVHLEEDFAKKTRFGKRIAHGMWGAALISSVLGMYLPGPGTIYLSQTYQFQLPVYLNDTITAVVTVQAVREDKPILELETKCVNQNGQIVLQGEAVVMVEEREE